MALVAYYSGTVLHYGATISASSKWTGGWMDGMDESMNP